MQKLCTIGRTIRNDQIKIFRNKMSDFHFLTENTGTESWILLWWWISTEGEFLEAPGWGIQLIEKVEFLNCIGCRGRLVSGRTLKKASGALHLLRWGIQWKFLTCIGCLVDNWWAVAIPRGCTDRLLDCSFVWRSCNCVLMFVLMCNCVLMLTSDWCLRGNPHFSLVSLAK